MKRGDLILIAAVAAAAILLALLFGMGGRGADRVVIMVDGAEYRSAPLSQNQRIEIDIGGKLNVVAIEDGAAYMHSANCPDKLCVRQGRIRAGSQSIVCLPNRVVVKLVKEPGAGESGGEGESGGAYDVDTIAQ
ncbi:MAG: NusG domain II-containing protein [Clostridiales bacterium]|jgi:hypothetical protein|nr:NusG domain II-containing protein [Clostridiales bacterium]